MSRSPWVVRITGSITSEAFRKLEAYARLDQAMFRAFARSSDALAISSMWQRCHGPVISARKSVTEHSDA